MKEPTLKETIDTNDLDALIEMMEECISFIKAKRIEMSYEFGDRFIRAGKSVVRVMVVLHTLSELSVRRKYWEWKPKD